MSVSFYGLPERFLSTPRHSRPAVPLGSGEEKGDPDSMEYVHN